MTKSIETDIQVKDMEITINIPDPILWIGGTIVAILVFFAIRAAIYAWLDIR